MTVTVEAAVAVGWLPGVAGIGTPALATTLTGPGPSRPATASAQCRSSGPILRVTQGGGRPTALGRALAEYGRIPKTFHLLSWLDDPAYRGGVGGQLNLQESRHRLARKIFHGSGGQLRQAYREGQEDQLSALGLVGVSGLNAPKWQRIRLLTALSFHGPWRRRPRRMRI